MSIELKSGTQLGACLRANPLSWAPLEPEKIQACRQFHHTSLPARIVLRAACLRHPV